MYSTVVHCTLSTVLQPNTALHNLNINCNPIIFADDTSVCISEPSNKTLCKSLNLVILNVHEWFTNNRLILNIDKTKFVP